MKEMEEKENMLSVMINICTRVVTLIFVAITIFMLFSNRFDTVRFTMRDIGGILLMGIISGLSVGIFFIKKNTTKLEDAFLQMLQFLILNISLLVISLKLDWFEKKASSLITMEIMFILVFFAVYTLLYLFDFNETKKINQKLKDRKNSTKF